MLPKLARLAKRDGLFGNLFYQKIYHYEVKFAKNEEGGQV